MIRELNPFDLSWSEVDPRRHPFDGASALAAVSALGPAGRVPTRPTGHPGDPVVIAWSHGEGEAWTDAMSRALMERFGRWALGWRWSRDEGDIGGGPVGGWCCPRDSITTPDETLTRIAGALCEWRAWLEELAEHFDRYPLGTLPAEDRQHAWDRAAAQLVTLVVDRTRAGDAWYAHCGQVLTWLLTRWGVAPESARAQVDLAIGGRFESWVEPEGRVVRDVAERLAASLQVGDGA